MTMASTTFNDVHSEHVDDVDVGVVVVVVVVVVAVVVRRRRRLVQKTFSQLQKSFIFENCSNMLTKPLLPYNSML